MIQAISAISHKKATSKKKLDAKHSVPTFQAAMPHKNAVPDTFVKSCKK